MFVSSRNSEPLILGEVFFHVRSQNYLLNRTKVYVNLVMNTLISIVNLLKFEKKVLKLFSCLFFFYLHFEIYLVP